MNFSFDPRVQALRIELLQFFAQEIDPSDRAYYEEVARNRVSGNPWVPNQVVESPNQRLCRFAGSRERLASTL